MPIPQGYHLDSRINTGLALGGVSLWAAPYVTGLIAAAASGFSKGSGWLALPVIGPFVAMGGRSIDCSPLGESNSADGSDLSEIERKCRESAIAEARVLALLTVDGLLQTTGAILTVAGVLSPREVLLRNDVFPPDTKLTLDADYQRGQLRLWARLQF